MGELAIVWNACLRPLCISPVRGLEPPPVSGLVNRHAKAQPAIPRQLCPGSHYVAVRSDVPSSSMADALSPSNRSRHDGLPERTRSERRLFYTGRQAPPVASSEASIEGTDPCSRSGMDFHSVQGGICTAPTLPGTYSARTSPLFQEHTGGSSGTICQTWRPDTIRELRIAKGSPRLVGRVRCR